MNFRDVSNVIKTNKEAPKPRKRLISQVKFLVIHCSDSNECTVKDLVQWHEIERGWAKPGYTYLVRKNADVYKLGFGSEIYNHVSEYNSVSLGICLEGSFDKEHITSIQFKALFELLAELKKIYPQAELKFHREFEGVTKTCPGLFLNPNHFREEFEKLKISEENQR